MSKVQKYKLRNGRLDAFALLFGGIIGLGMVGIILLPPQIEFLNHAYVVSQGSMGFGLLVFAFFWAVIEMYTPPGAGFLSLVIRFFTALIIGGFLGGFLGQEFYFGQYVLVPVAHGNYLAMFFLVTVLVLFFVLLISAVWNHNSTYIVSSKKAAGS
jgi:hypothetical protein